MFDVLLQTSRLVLRPFAPGDEPAFAAYRSDPEVARYQTWDTPYRLADAERFVAEQSAADPRALGWFQYAVERRSEPGLIGDVGVCRRDEGRQAELGFTFAPAHQRHGYAREAVTRIVEFLLVEEGLHRLVADADGRNARSARLLERVGFRREGHRIASTWIKGEWTDDLLFGLLASEWPVRRPGEGGEGR